VAAVERKRIAQESVVALRLAHAYLNPAEWQEVLYSLEVKLCGSSARPSAEEIDQLRAKVKQLAGELKWWRKKVANLQPPRIPFSAPYP
jgi:hypothetical protein